MGETVAKYAEIKVQIEVLEQKPPIHPAADREDWRKWLLENHASAKAVWLIYMKPASGKPRVSYDDAVDEAICFGWIDSKPNALDEFRSLQFFAPRNPKRNWSKVNKQRVERLLAEGRMQPAGLAVIELAFQIFNCQDKPNVNMPSSCLTFLTTRFSNE